MVCFNQFSSLKLKKPPTLVSRSRIQMRPLNGKGALQEFLRVEKDQIESKSTVKKLKWQSPLKIVKYPDPRLRAPNAKIRKFDEQLQKLADEMFEIMYQDDGVGLAAPQVGVNVRMMVFNKTGNPSQKQYEKVLINPYIVKQSKQTEVGEEGCLSFPGLLADVERSTEIRVKAVDVNGKATRLDLYGFPAIIFQHEYDHLEGVLYYDRMVPAELQKIRKQLIEMEDVFRKSNPNVEFQSIQ